MSRQPRVKVPQFAERQVIFKTVHGHFSRDERSAMNKVFELRKKTLAA